MFPRDAKRNCLLYDASDRPVHSVRDCSPKNVAPSQDTEACCSKLLLPKCTTTKTPSTCCFAIVLSRFDSNGSAPEIYKSAPLAGIKIEAPGTLDEKQSFLRNQIDYGKDASESYLHSQQKRQTQCRHDLRCILGKKNKRWAPLKKVH